MDLWMVQAGLTWLRSDLVLLKAFERVLAPKFAKESLLECGASLEGACWL